MSTIAITFDKHIPKVWNFKACTFARNSYKYVIHQMYFEENVTRVSLAMVDEQQLVMEIASPRELMLAMVDEQQLVMEIASP